MITLASSNNQNIQSGQITNEGILSNTDTNTGPITESKLHSQITSDMYVFNI